MLSCKNQNDFQKFFLQPDLLSDTLAQCQVTWSSRLEAPENRRSSASKHLPEFAFLIAVDFFTLFNGMD